MRIGAGRGVVVGEGVAARLAGPRARGPLARGIFSRATAENSSGLRRPLLLFRVRVGSGVVIRAGSTNFRLLRISDVIRAVMVPTTSLSLDALRKARPAATGARRSVIYVIIWAAVLVVVHLRERSVKSVDIASMAMFGLKLKLH